MREESLFRLTFCEGNRRHKWVYGVSQGQDPKWETEETRK